jgi:hypothetical protein
VIDIGVRMRKKPPALIWIRRKIVQHILMNFLLKIDADGAVCPNNFIRADTGFGRNIPVWVGNADVGRIIANRNVRALHGSLDQFLKELLVCWRNCGRTLRQRGDENKE